MNKKKFVINKISYTIVIGHRNYLEYWKQYKNSKHLIRVRTSKGFRSATTLEQLEIMVLPIIASLQNLPTEDIKRPSKLHDYIFNHKYRYKPRTYKQFEGVCNRFVKWCEANKIKPHLIDYSNAHRFIRESSETRKNGTLWNIQLVLKTIFNGLLKEKLIIENVFANLPKIKKSPNSLMYFNSKQIAMIKAHLKLNDVQLLRAIMLVFSCGIRTDELRHLQIMDIIYEDSLIEVRGEISKKMKSRKAFLNDAILKELEPLATYPGHFYLFGKNGVPAETMVSYNYLNDKHRQVLKALKIVGRYALYSWKHTGAVAMVRAGVNVKLIQKQFGHSSLDMTDEYLKNLGITSNDDLKNKMPNL